MKLGFRIHVHLFTTLLMSMGLVACHEVKPPEETVSEHQSTVSTHHVQQHDMEGESLKNLVSQPGIYSEIEPQQQLSESAKKLMGRYHVRLSCQDPIALCKEGSADFIVTLLDNGHVRRTIIYLGAVSPIEDRQYRQDRWSYNEKTGEVIVHLPEGADFYMHVNEHNNLVMDLDKMLSVSAANKAFFEQNPMPLYAYELKKDQN